ncbi:MAG: transporter [Fimbriimonadaceae bacterium]|nr:transporter [Fimbriimonadaceae bacterium]
MRHGLRSWVGLALLAAALPATAQETGHYIWGVEGIRAASLPPPGIYYRQYNAFYNAQTLTDRSGNIAPVGFGVSVFANVHRLIYVSKAKILGGNYAADIIVPLVDTHLTIDAVPLRDNRFGLYDVCIEPFILAWHTKRFDAAFALGAWLPVGMYDAGRPASPGKDFFSGMTTLGGTWYIDAPKLWALSVLNRTEFHGKSTSRNVTPGMNTGFEWALSRALPTKEAIWEFGLVGYDQWQLTDDSGAGARVPVDIHDSTHALGGEVSVFVPSAKAVFSLRSLWEYSTTDRSRGNFTNFTVTGMF